MKINKKIALILVLIFTLALTACSSDTKDSITVGSRNNTESIILANIMGQLIEAKTDLTVVRKDNLGGSNVLWNALLGNEIQLIPDYTGTIVANYYQEPTGTADETLASTKRLIDKDGLHAFNAFGFNNTYTLAIAESMAQELDVTTFSEFAKVSDTFIFGAVFEFIDRPDGLPGFQKEYDIHFKEVKGMDHGMMYRSFQSGDVNVINSYSTDGQLQIYDLRVLEDDKAFFPPYHALPIIRQDALEKHPELTEVLQLLEGKIDETAMQKLNGKVDNDALRADVVAKEFLKESGLID
ncbi:glycine/betaine ABC transporter substrate-binding protein [Paenibacillaceae bacterium]|nr:glycine/betaine ABC transporter substrate-binding protein [Paenibacillaceae bacterium]